MAYVITDNCIKDHLCVDVCPTDCIHPKTDEPKVEEVAQLYVDPAGCIDCGACVPACTSDAIFAAEDVPEDKKEFAGQERGLLQLGCYCCCFPSRPRPTPGARVFISL